MIRKICVVTGTRAEYGILRTLLKEIDERDSLELQLIVTNMHLRKEYGYTIQEIESDGFSIDATCDILKYGTSKPGIAKSTGVAVELISESFERLNPDLILLLGDRYEMLAAATAATILNIPIAHLHGGEITEGAMDDAMRHAITKLSHLHLTASDVYQRRVIQMGERPETTFNVGSLGIQNAREIETLTFDALQKSLGCQLDKSFLVVTYHPETSTDGDGTEGITHLLKAIDAYPGSVIFTQPNSDPGSEKIRKRIDAYVKKNAKKCFLYASLGQKRYFSALKYAQAVVGNSSSGIIEAPSFDIPTVNIGARQAGRLRAESIFDAAADLDDIKKALAKAVAFNQFPVTNPYEQQNTRQRVIEILEQTNLSTLLPKRFYDLR